MHADAMTKVEERWLSRVKEWRAEGGSAYAFAKARHFAPGTLQWWAERLEYRGLVGPKALPTRSSRSIVNEVANLVRVEREPPREGARELVGIDILTGRVIVEHGFDAALLREVVAALRAS